MTCRSDDSLDIHLLIADIVYNARNIRKIDLIPYPRDNPLEAVVEFLIMYQKQWWSELTSVDILQLSTIIKKYKLLSILSPVPWIRDWNEEEQLQRYYRSTYKSDRCSKW